MAPRRPWVLLVLVAGACASSWPGHAAFEEAAAASAAHAAVFDSDSVRLPLEVSVALVGLDGSGANGFRLDAGALAALLSQGLPSHTPSVLEAGRPLSLSYELSYNIRHLPAAVPALEAALRASLVSTGWEALAGDGEADSLPRARSFERLEAVLLVLF